MAEERKRHDTTEGLEKGDWQMNADDKIVEYELQIADMLHVIQERLEEFNDKKLDDFELGRKLASTEMMDIIKTRHQMILDVISDDDCP